MKNCIAVIIFLLLLGRAFAQNYDTLTEVQVVSPRTLTVSGKLRDIEGTSVYAGKKTELIQMNNINANLANNNTRQIYARIPGLNIWEYDRGGLQLGIGGRGLSPNRSSNFNIRQNGYDISADALGYPESYYTPSAEALDRIEIVRGAAGLQYGPQFGGLVNFVMKEGPEDKRLALTTVRQAEALDCSIHLTALAERSQRTV
jgi:Fe(3+) dicitrate transport protein